VLNRGPSLWADHRKEVLAAAAAMTMLGALAVALWVERRRRTAAEMEARHQMVASAQLARSAAMGELSASVAHEINQPLGAIVNNAEAARLLLTAGRDPAIVDEALRSIRDDATRAAQVVERIRALFRKQPLVVRQARANASLQQVLSLAKAEAQRRGIALVQDLGTGLPDIAADPVYLEQVALNLLINALDAVESASVEQREVSVTTRQDGDAVAFTIADTGQGIPEDRLGQVFDAFYTTKRDGLGMGLAIARTIVEAHGGRISARNLRRGGAEFRFTIPRWKGSA
jgi:signal transduction histidine kinase